MPVVDEIQEVLNNIGEILITQEPIDTDIDPLALDASLEDTVLKVNELIELVVATAEETNKGRADILRIQRAILGTLSNVTSIETTNEDLSINNTTLKVYLPNPVNPNNETLVSDILDSLSATNDSMQVYYMFELIVGVPTVLEDTDVVDLNSKLAVIAEDGITAVEYGMMPIYSAETDIESSEPTYVVDNTLFTLTLPTNTIESSVVLAALSSTDDSIQTIQILDGVTPIGASDPVLNTYTVSVTAENLVTIQEYTIVIP